jgi:hypothetical protein
MARGAKKPKDDPVSLINEDFWLGRIQTTFDAVSGIAESVILPKSVVGELRAALYALNRASNEVSRAALPRAKGRGSK